MQHTDQTTQPLTGNLVPATYEPTQGSAWTMPGPRLDIDLDTALTLLTDSEVERIVAQATAEVHGPQLSTTPQHTPGTIKAYVPGMPHPIYVHPAQPVEHTAPPVVVRQPVVSRWAVNTSLTSLSLSGAALIGSFALEQFAVAAAAVVAAVASMGWFLLGLAVVLGVIHVASKKAGAPKLHVDQTVHQEFQVKGGGWLNKTHIDSSGGITNTIKR
ncbi:hypothetical protein AB0D90_31285 [Streptomyces althioticus]|uniref:hypothetical protein n=1 Tax=Streptomyces althioticus TaxID=83380 RepID=UPI0033F42EF0